LYSTLKSPSARCSDFESRLPEGAKPGLAVVVIADGNQETSCAVFYRHPISGVETHYDPGGRGMFPIRFCPWCGCNLKECFQECKTLNGR
jgi:hypothetical protein